MKVLIVHNEYGKFSGEEKVIYDQIHSLHENGITVITYIKKSSSIKGIFSKILAFFSGIYSLKSKAEIANIIREEKPDIVHIHNIFPLISSSIFKEIKKFDIPIVMTLHNFRIICPTGLFYNKNGVCEECYDYGEYRCIKNNCTGNLLKSINYSLRTFINRKLDVYNKYIDVFFSLNTFQKKKISNSVSGRIHIIPNSVNITQVEINKNEEDYFGYLGRISKEKGIDLLIELADRMPDQIIKLAGDIDSFYVDKVGKIPNIVLVGFLSGQELDVFIMKAKLFIFPSQWYEGFPMSLLELLKFKKIIIASNMGGIPDIIQNKVNGLIFDNSIESLVETIEEINKNNILKEIIRENTSLSINRFDSKYWINEIISCYTALVQ